MRRNILITIAALILSLLSINSAQANLEHTSTPNIEYGDNVSSKVGDISSSPNSTNVHDAANHLLLKWVASLYSYQLDYTDSSLNGGILCPSCNRVHGRCGEAILPFLYTYEKTGDEKYLSGAKKLMSWMENVHLHDGSWMNDVNVSGWNGTTVFMAISLYESLDNYGYLLDDSTKSVWQERLLKSGEFIFNNDIIYSRKREGMRNQNVNYSASAIYALNAIGVMFNRQDFIDKAQEIATDLKPFFTDNEQFLYGEGPNIWEKTKNGCLPIDLAYNVEESLPNMFSYAFAVNDKEFIDLLTKSMDTHLEFMLPDGAWDNSWGTRSFKWAYWGGRTSDGFMGQYLSLLVNERPAYYEAVKRNIALLNEATHNGLLYGGMHYLDNDMAPCIHHTFTHSKSLASFLKTAIHTPKETFLPRDIEYGVKHFKDINTWLVSENEWRSTITGYDSEYSVKGLHPLGGALSMLWSEKIGPVFAATMNTYTMVERPNMQAYIHEHQMAGTPRVELYENGIMYSNLDDLNTKIDYSEKDGKHIFHITTHLVDSEQGYSSFGKEAVEITYKFDSGEVIIKCTIPKSLRDGGARLTLPIISSPTEEINLTSRLLSVDKGENILLIETDALLNIAPVNKNGRIFNPVPGFSFIPIFVEPDLNGNIEVSLKVENKVI